MTVFNRFFTEMHLPYSIIRGEFFELVASVFFYARDGDAASLKVRVVLKSSPGEFKARKVDANRIPDETFSEWSESDVEDFVSVQSGRPARAVFHIVPTRLGHLRIRLSAVAENSRLRDAVEQTVIVEVSLALLDYDN